MSDDHLDPAVVARYEDIAARHRAVLAQLAEEHEREVTELRQASAEQEQKTKEYLDKLTAAVQRRDQAREAEQQNRWPEREKKERVLSFSEDNERPRPAPLAPPQARPMPPAPPPPPAPERPRERRVLSFSEDDEQPAPPPKPKTPEPQPSNSDRPAKGRVLNFSTEDEEDEGFQGFRRR